jgi:hypothetical protein
MRALLSVATLSLLSSTALAAGEITPLANGRALGMGGALRGAAAGDAALALNPSGMSLLRAYALEGEYLHGSGRSENDAHVSIVDSTSAFNVAGGLYYTYLSASPGGDAPDRSGHEGGFALSVPFGEKIFLGATAKYVRLTTKGGAAMADDVTKGLTFDVGATLRPTTFLGIGIVGYNLNDLHDRRLPFAVGGGITASPMDELLLAFDVLWDRHAGAGDQAAVHLMGGAEYTFARRVALRAGAGHRGGALTGTYVSGGLTLVSEVGALDGGVQRGLGDLDETLFVISARLFIPAP